MNSIECFWLLIGILPVNIRKCIQLFGCATKKRYIYKEEELKGVATQSKGVDIWDKFIIYLL